MKDHRAEAGTWNWLVPRELGELAARVLMPLVLALSQWLQWRQTDRSAWDLWPAAFLVGFALFGFWKIYFSRKSAADDVAPGSPDLS